MTGVLFLEFLLYLTILFIGLKLTGHIAWSWIWVIGPLWIPAAIVFCAGAISYVLAIFFDNEEDDLDK